MPCAPFPLGRRRPLLQWMLKFLQARAVEDAGRDPVRFRPAVLGGQDFGYRGQDLGRGPWHVPHFMWADAVRPYKSNEAERVIQSPGQHGSRRSCSGRSGSSRCGPRHGSCRRCRTSRRREAHDKYLFQVQLGLFVNLNCNLHTSHGTIPRHCPPYHTTHIH